MNEKKYYKKFIYLFLFFFLLNSPRVLVKSTCVYVEKKEWFIFEAYKRTFVDCNESKIFWNLDNSDIIDWGGTVLLNMIISSLLSLLLFPIFLYSGIIFSSIFKKRNENNVREWYNGKGTLDSRLSPTENENIYLSESFFELNGNLKHKGLVIQKIDFLPSSNIGEHKWYHYNGQLKEVGNWEPTGKLGILNPSSKRVGEFLYYNEKGVLIKKEYYNDDGVLQRTENLI